MLRENAPCAVLAALCLGLAALAAPAALAHSHKKRGLEIVHPWTSATSEPGGRTLVFMKIKNLSGAPERLCRASTPAAAKMELQEAAADNADAPAKAASAILIEPGKDVQLTRKGPHLALTGLKQRLDAYDSFKLTLVFEKAGRMVVDVMVEEAIQGAAQALMRPAARAPVCPSARHLRATWAAWSNPPMPLFKLSMAADGLASGRAAADLLGQLRLAGRAGRDAVREAPSGPGFTVEAYYDAQPSLADLAPALSALGAGLGRTCARARARRRTGWRYRRLPCRRWPPAASSCTAATTATAPAARRTAIEIEAGEAFGTGHNATTALCLEALDRLSPPSPASRTCSTSAAAPACWPWPPPRVLPHARVLAVDNDPVATA